MNFIRNRLGWEDRGFWKHVLLIGIPVVIQNLISSSLNMVDTVMIGRLGANEMVAVGLANQLFFLFTLILFGVNSGAGIFVAQFWGKRDVASIRRVQGLGLINGLVGAVLAMAVAYWLPRPFLALFDATPQVTQLGVDYLAWVAWSYIPTAITFTFAFTLRSIGQPKLSTLASAVAIVVNTVLNYIFIFGKLGCPVMGVKGAALATGIARIAELVIIMGGVYGKRMVPAARLKEMWPRGKAFIAQYYKTSMPVFFNEFIWALGTTVYSMIYGRMGTEALAALNIVGTISRMTQVTLNGVGQATSVLVGSSLGAGELAQADTYAKRFLFMGPLMGAIFGVVQCAISPAVVLIYNVSDAVRMLSVWVLLIDAGLAVFRSFNFVNIVGILRSGGDTKFCLFLDVAGVWMIGIPLAALGTLALHLPLQWVFLLVCCDEIFKAIVGLKRYMGKKWLRNIVDVMT